MIHILPHTERFIDVFEQLKRMGKLPSNTVIAMDIGMKSANTLTEIRKRRQNIKIQHLQKFCDLYNIDFQEIINSQQDDTPTPYHPATDADPSKELIPYFDNDYLTEDTQSAERGEGRPLYYMNIPEFTGCIAFRIRSDSMAPLIKPGGIMFCKKVEDWAEILEYGQVYLIRLKDNRRFLKYIRKHSDKNRLIFKSANPDQDDFDVLKSKIDSIWLVEGWMNKKIQ